MEVRVQRRQVSLNRSGGIEQVGGEEFVNDRPATVCPIQEPKNRSAQLTLYG